jgi:hypothetical protein
MGHNNFQLEKQSNNYTVRPTVVLTQPLDYLLYKLFHFVLSYKF